MQAIGWITCDAERAKLREDNRARTKVPRIRKIVLPDISKIPGARKGLLPAFLAPSLASLTDRPPSGPKWVHEIKYDGYRMQARVDGLNIRLLTRKSLDWTERFRSIATARSAPSRSALSFRIAKISNNGFESSSDAHTSRMYASPTATKTIVFSIRSYARI